MAVHRCRIRKWIKRVVAGRFLSATGLGRVRSVYRVVPLVPPGLRVRGTISGPREFIGPSDPSSPFAGIPVLSAIVGGAHR